MTDTLNAAVIAPRSERGGPGLDPPLYLPREFVLARFAGGIVVDGGPTPRLLEGPATESGLFFQLAAALDGSGGLEQVTSRMAGYGPLEVRRAVSTLTDLGMIEPVASGVPADVNACTLGFYRRFRLGYGYASGDEAYNALRAARVLVVAPGAYNTDATGTDELAAMLTGIGIGWREAAEANPSDSRPTLVVFFSFTGDDLAAEREAEASALRAGVPLLRVVADFSSNWADIGPLFAGDFSPCFDCFWRLHGREGSHPARKPEPYARLEWISLAAAEIARVIARIGQPICGSGLRRYENLSLLTSTSLSLVRFPGCSRCRPAPHGSAAKIPEPAEIPAALLLEDCVAGEPRGSGMERQRTPIASLDGLGEPQPRTVRMLCCPKLLLEGRAAEPGAISNPGRLTAGTLGEILRLTAGLREPAESGEQPLRWAPTGGNLGSVEAYALALSVEGLAPGLYFYDAADHALTDLARRRALTSADFLIEAAPTFAPDPPNALIILTGAFHRLAPKYGAFGYRLTQLDAGAAIAQLRLVAEGLGLHAKVASRWPDDPISRELGLRPLAEQVTGAIGVWAREPVLTTARAAARRFSLGRSRWSLDGGLRWPATDTRSAQGVSKLPRPAPARRSGGVERATRRWNGLPAADIARAVYDASRLTAHELGPPGPTVVAYAPALGPNEALPPPAAPAIPLWQALARRKSVRAFQPRPIPHDYVSALAVAAADNDRAAWRTENDEGRPLRLILLASRVEGVDRGAYECRAETNRLFRLRDIAMSDLEPCFVQPDLAQAPAAFWIVGNLHAACARHGEFGHRQLLSRAGAAGQSLAMAAIRLGMSGCLLGGMVPGAGRHLLGLDGYWSAGLLGFVFGFENTGNEE